MKKVIGVVVGIALAAGAAAQEDRLKQEVLGAYRSAATAQQGRVLAKLLESGASWRATVERGVCWDPASSQLPGHRWVAQWRDRIGSPINRQSMPVGTPTPWDLGGDPDRPPPQTCEIRSAYRRWQGYTAGVDTCPGDRFGQPVCGTEAEPIYGSSLAALYAHRPEQLTSRRGCDGVPTKEELWFATASCANGAVCRASILPGGLRAPGCYDARACATTPGCYASKSVAAGTIGYLEDVMFGCEPIPVCGIGAGPPPPRCGDGRVDPGETCKTCPADAGECPPPPPIEIACRYSVACQGGIIRIAPARAPCQGEVTFKPGTASTGRVEVCLGEECAPCSS